MIAARAIERAADIREVLDRVIDDAKAGDKAQARNLLGYLTAAFPDVGEAGNARAHGEALDLTTLSTSELQALAHGPSTRAE